MPIDYIEKNPPKFPETPQSNHRLLSKIYQRSFLMWACKEVQEKYPQQMQIPEDEIRLRVSFANFFHTNPQLALPSEIPAPDRIEMVENLETLLSSGIEAAKIGCENLINSRNAEIQNRALT